MTDYTDFQCDAAVAAHLAKPSHDIVHGVLLTNANTRITELDKFDMGRFRRRGDFNTNSVSSFAKFINDKANLANTAVFLDKDAMKAVAILNFEEDDFEQGHLDYRAIMTAKPTTVFDKLTAMHKQGRINQKAFAEFLEDWAFIFKAINSDGEEIAISSAIGAVRQMRLDASVVSDSSVGNFKESRSRLASIEAKSTHGALPAFFEVTDPCFNELTASTIKLRLAVSSNGDDPVFSLSIMGLEALIDAKSVELADLIAKELGDTVKLYMGQFGG